MIQASLIIRSYNEEAHIGRLLSGVIQQKIENLEIILVDSGSTDATISIAEQYPVRILSIKKENFSFGRSLNIGCKAAEGEFLVFASAHVYPIYCDWAEKLLAPFTDENVVCSYGRQCGNELTKFSEHQVFSQWFPEQSESIQDHPFCNNANAAIRKSVWERFQYDESLTGLEDLAWAKQAISEGFRIAYCPDAEVVHVHEETFPQVFNRYRREAIAMKAIFPNEKFSIFDFLHTFHSNIFSDSRLAIKQKTFWRNSMSIIAFRLMQFWGTYRGFAQHGALSQTLRQKFYYPKRNSDLVESDIANADKRKRIDYTGQIR